MDPKQCSVLQELSRVQTFGSCTATEGFPSPAIAPTLAAEEGLFPPRLHCFLLRQVCLGRGDKEHAGAFWGLSLRFSGFNCDLVSPCRAQERALDPQAAARNA